MPHPADINYGMLKAKLEYIDKEEEEFRIISKYVEATSSQSRNQLLDVWRVDRDGEGQRFSKHSNLDHRKLLWHGTNVAVVAAILKTGLRIMPHSGGRVGKGIYLASEQSKSAAYAWGAKDSFIMFLNEAALGKEHPIKKDDHTLTKPPSGFDSVVARGQTEPDPTHDITTVSYTHLTLPTIYSV